MSHAGHATLLRATHCSTLLQPWLQLIAPACLACDFSIARARRVGAYLHVTQTNFHPSNHRGVSCGGRNGLCGVHQARNHYGELSLLAVYDGARAQEKHDDRRPAVDVTSTPSAPTTPGAVATLRAGLLATTITVHTTT